MISFKAFRAIDNFELSEKFAVGHESVLASYGIKKVTSSNRSWMLNPGVYALIAIDKSKDIAIGGARIQLVSNKHQLPLEEAVGKKDPLIHNLITNYSDQKTGEICGIWNSRDLSGTGLSVLLLRACIAETSSVVANQLNLSTLFALCAPWTVKMFKNMGYEVEESVGNKGTYIYPTPDLLATVMIMKDPKNLSWLLTEERDKIFNLRKNPKQTKVEAGIKNFFLIDYNLIIKNFKS